MAYTAPTFPATMPTGANGMTQLVSLLKEIYVAQRVQNLIYTKRPLYGMLAKEENAIGKLFPLPIIVDANASNNSFSYAQSNTSALLTAEFMLQRAKVYNVAQIDGETIRAASADLGSFARSVTSVMDGGFESVANMVSLQLYRGGTGSSGQINAIATGVITLQDPNSATYFSVNQVLQANATDGGTTPLGALGYVIAVNRTGGTITVSATAGGSAGTPTGWVPTYYLVTQGNNNLAIQGLASWLVNPAAISPSDSFFGVNRSIDSRLSGCYFDGSAEPIEDAILDAAAQVANQGGQPDVFFCNYASFTYLVKSLGAKAQFVQEITATAGEGQEVEVFYSGVVINGPAGPITVMADRSCPAQTGFLLEMSTWKLYSAGPAIGILDHEGHGLEMLRLNNYDAVEIRQGGYLQLGCNAPIRNALVKLIA